MAEVLCRRCDSTGQGLDGVPLPGPVGLLVQSQTCRECWDLWRGEQVKLINEHKLSPAKREDFDFLVDEMKGFLKLERVTT